jgi:hypothetical protein
MLSLIRARRNSRPAGMSPAQLKAYDQRTSTMVANLLFTISSGQMSAADVDSLTEVIMEVEQGILYSGMYWPIARSGEYVVHASRETQPIYFSSRDAARDFADDVKAGAYSGPQATQYNFYPNSFTKISKVPNSNDWQVVVTERAVSMYPSLSAAEIGADELRAHFGAAVRGPETKEEFKVTIRDPNALSRVGTMLKRDLQSTVSQRAVDLAVINMLSEGSARKFELRRENVAGANPEDVSRVFAERAMGAAWTMAELKTARRQADVMEEIRDYVRKSPSGKQQRMLGRLMNELRKREEQHLADADVSAIADNLTRMGYYLMLASPSYSLINAMQVPMVTLPYLQGKYGLKASRSVLRNMREVAGSRALITDFKQTQYGTMDMPEDFITGVSAQWGVRPSFIRYAAGDPDLVQTKGDMLHALVEANTIDTGLMTELTATLRGKSLSSGAQIWHRMTTWSKAWPQYVEQINRVVTAGATYDLAVASGKTPAEATQLAKEAVKETQGDYSDGNRNRFMKSFGKYNRVIFMFKTYAQFITALYIKNAAAVVKPPPYMSAAEAKAYRKEGLATLAALTASHAAVTGVIGAIPQPLMWVFAAALAAFGDEDDPKDVPMLVEGGLNKLLGPTLGEAASRGAVRMIPGAGDIHARLGLSSLIVFPPPSNKEGADLFAHYTLQMLGPMASWGGKVFQGATDIWNGDIKKGLVGASPKLIRDAVTSMDYMTDGVMDGRHRALMAPEQLSVWDVVMKGVLGFEPADVARQKELRFANIKYETAVARRSRLLVTKWISSDRPEADIGLIEEIVRFNAENPNSKITLKTLNTATRSKLKEQARQQAGLYFRNKDTVLELPWANPGLQ